MSDTNAAGADTNYDWRGDWNLVQSRIGYDQPEPDDAMHRLAAHIESLGAEADQRTHEFTHALMAQKQTIERLVAERDALLAEHEWEKALRVPMNKHARKVIEARYRAAHDHAEEVINKREA